MSTPHSRSTSVGVMCPRPSRTGTVSVKVPLPWSRQTSVTPVSGARNSQNSEMPPSWTKTSSTGSSPRSSRTTIVSPGTRKEVCRARARSPSRSNAASLRKICRSAQYRTRVPVTPRLAVPMTSRALVLM